MGYNEEILNLKGDNTMEDSKIIKVAAVLFIGFVVAPIVINATINLVEMTVVGIGNKINTVKFHKKIKKGLKEGSIVCVDGSFYEVEIEDKEAE